MRDCVCCMPERLGVLTPLEVALWVVVVSPLETVEVIVATVVGQLQIHHPFHWSHHHSLILLAVRRGGVKMVCSGFVVHVAPFLVGERVVV